MKFIRLLAFGFLATILAQMGALSQTTTPMRRPISPEKPVWLVHIDTWNYADPQKIIALIPQEIRPFVVMNLSLSISHNETTSQFQVAEYGYEVAKSWLRACAENRMWAMVQPSSGGFSQFSDFDLSVYHEFYRDYPNFIGFNYCEQFWGYDSTTDPLSAKWADRINHFANLLELSSQYGGYLVVSWCGNQWSPNINPIGMVKRVPAFAAACREYTEHFILCEKYTQQGYQSDMESLCLGAWLSGYSGQYGIRYDDTGWTDSTGTHANFTMATQAAPQLEHMMLTGQTVVDGPELIWTQCFQELGAGSTDNGFTMRRWGTFPQFDNVSVDLFRKVIDGTVRIPSRREVIDRTKVVVINDVNSGNANTIYSSPQTLFEGLYRMDGDGNYEFNKTFFKKTGRYPTVPTVYQLDDADANSFQIKVNRSAYATRWPSVTAKVNEFNTLFPSESTGDLYAGRHENGWVIYNPYKTGQTASASIPFRYNTCERMDLTFSQYTTSIAKETADKLTFYLSNYDNVLDTGLKTDIIAIHGAATEPTWSYVERGSHQASVISKDWTGGVFTLTVQYNGPLDITVNCAGSATGRLTQFTPSAITHPDPPKAFAGPRQYEAECFDYKSISGITKGGYAGSIRNYTGQGYLQFGNGSTSAVRDSVTVLKPGIYRLDTRYAVTGADITSVDLYVNGSKVATPTFTQTATLSDWAVLSQNVNLNAGANTIEYRANATRTNSLYFDNIVVTPTSYGYGTVIQENETGFVRVNGSIGNDNPGFTGVGFANSNDAAGAGIDWQMYFDESPVKSFTFRYACTADLTADMLIDGSTVATGVRFPSTGALSTWGFITVHGGASEGISNVRLQAVSAGGLPNVDYVEVVGGGLGPAQTIDPSEDAYVRDGGSAAANFGTATELVVKKRSTAGTGFTRNTYLKFDVSGLASAQSVKLKLTPYQVDGAATLEYGLLADDSWSENAITWNNQPTAASTPIGTVSGYVVGQTIELDVTAAAKSEAAGDGILSLRITEPNNSDIFIGFSSREHTNAGLRPVLESVTPVVSSEPAMIAHLRLDDGAGTTATDTTGNGWTGTLVNSPTWTSEPNARINGALRLTGASDQHVTLPSGILNGLNDFTVSFWVNPNTISTWARVFDFSTGTTQNSMYFTPRTAGGVARFGLRVNGVAQNLEAAAPLTNGAWTHVAVTLSGNNGTLYLNGAVAASSTTMTLRPNGLGVTTVNTLGKSSSADPYLDGTVDDFRLYGIALDPSDIATLAAMPNLPVNLTATPSSSQVTLNWTPVNSSSAYTVMRSPNSEGPYTTLATVSEPTFTDTLLPNGVPRYYVVSVASGIAKGSSSAEVSATPASTFTQWIATSFPGQSNPSIIGAGADPDGDGFRNLIEYFLGGSPSSPDLQGAVNSTRDGGGNLVLTYRMAKNLVGITHDIQSSGNATNWQNTGIAPVLVSDQGSHLLMKATVPTNGASRMFLRIEARSE